MMRRDYWINDDKLLISRASIRFLIQIMIVRKSFPNLFYVNLLKLRNRMVLFRSLYVKVEFLPLL